MAQSSPTPPNIREACEVLGESGVCRIVRAVESFGDVLSQVVIALEVVQPNLEGLPASIEFDCYIAHPYPHAEIEIIPKGDAVRGFPHQATDGGKLCLPPAQDAPWDLRRLLTFVKWTKEWLGDAAAGQLLKPGDPYELPDFRQRKVPDPSLRDVPQVLFDESIASYSAWQGRVGQSGDVSLALCKSANVIAATNWFALDKTECRAAGFSPAFLQRSSQFRGQWLLLPTLTAFRHRPPRDYEELAALCRASGVHHEKILRRAWANSRSDIRYGVVLLGCPIPRTIGEAPSEIHWQPFLIPNKEAGRLAYTGRGKRDEGLLWRAACDTVFGPARLLTWGQATNISRDRQYVRGAAPSEFANQKLAIVGAGAIGSLLVETFARAGVAKISMFDDDRLEFGNLCRHSLDGTDVGKHKAAALASRLTSANPLSVIDAYSIDVPFSQSGNERQFTAMAESDVLIDSSTDHGAFLWMSAFARMRRKRCASMFINRNATLLTLVMSGRNTSAAKVFDRLNSSISSGGTSIDRDEYFGRNDGIGPLLPGPGCWHPTFPARNNHIASLVAASVDLLYDWIQNGNGCDGRAIIIRRREESPIVEIALDIKYR